MALTFGTGILPLSVRATTLSIETLILGATTPTVEISLHPNIGYLNPGIRTLGLGGRAIPPGIWTL